MKAISRLHAGQYSSSGKFISWLMRIAHNVIIDYYRSQCVFRMVEQGNDNDLPVCEAKIFRQTQVEQEMVRKQVLRDVKKLVDFLPAPQREVVYMRFISRCLSRI